MKRYRILIVLLMLMVAHAASAQFDIFARMNVAKGNPKQVTSPEGVMEFDQSGHLTRIKSGNEEAQYSWNGNKVTMTAYRNGQSIGTSTITIVQDTPEKIVLDIDGVATYTTTYRADGQQLTSVQEERAIGQTYTLRGEMIYASATGFPTSVVMSDGNETQTASLRGWTTDAKGNWISYSSEVNGQFSDHSREITYY